jgi:pimeloyl-ACP methyl ester carboxylesterase
MGRLPPPPGRLVDVGGFSLHLNCTGQGTPTVILDAALGGSSISWAMIQPEVARFARVCSYDRAGFGWSDQGPQPRTAERIAQELATLLERGGITPPYVLVGHSFGGLVIRVFAQHWPRSVAGLVFVDPAHPVEWIEPTPEDHAKMERGARLCRHGVRATRWGVAHVVASLAYMGQITPARKIMRLASRGELSVSEESILAPMWKLPAEARAPLRYFWTQPKFFEALGSQIENVSISARQAQEADHAGYGDLPLVTISSTHASATRLAHQDQLASRSSRGRHIIASNSGHWIPLDQPEVIVSAIQDVLLRS